MQDNKYFREYREKNKEKLRDYQKEYHKKYREKNKEKLAILGAKYQRKYYKKNKEKILEKIKKYEQKNKEKIKAYQQKYQKEYTKTYYKINKFKSSVRSKTLNAVKTGKIKKENCYVCGLKKSEIHHNNYNDYLDILWLCKKHHTELHKRLELISK